MARGLEKKQQKEIDLNLEGVPEGRVPGLKKEIGDIIINSIRRNLSSGQSPVENGEYKSTLSSKYAKEMKQGNTTANLQLDGDLLSSVKYDINTGRDSIIVGVMNDTQLGKAQGHNRFNGQKKGKLPTRRFIPSSGERFKQSTMNRINAVIERNRVPKFEFPERSEIIEENLSRLSPNDLESRVENLVAALLAET